jgi:general stress protein 26
MMIMYQREQQKVSATTKKSRQMGHRTLVFVVALQTSVYVLYGGTGTKNYVAVHAVSSLRAEQHGILVNGKN